MIWPMRATSCWPDTTTEDPSNVAAGHEISIADVAEVAAKVVGYHGQLR
jgi:hypothetical protein